MSAHHDAHLPTREELTHLLFARPTPNGLRTVSLVLALLGFGLFLFGAATGKDRAWQAFHVNWLFFTTIASSGVMLAATQRITTARWSRAVIRIVEGFVAWLPVAFVLLLVTLLFGKVHIFPWITTPPAAPEKALWLKPSFFVARVLVAFGFITALSLWFVYTSVRLDVGVLPEWGAKWAKGWRERMRRGFRDERREIHSTHSLQGRLSVILAISFGFLWTMLAWDLSMSLDVHFQSTMYGWQIFMGAFVAMLMVFAILLRAWRSFLGAEDIITDKHFHDVGKLCFAFTAFWGYLTFSQLLVIWYGNVGEETHFLRLRLIGVWKPLTLTVVYLMFVIPFFTLLSKTAKLYGPVMSLIALCGIVGLWIHRYIEIYPSIYVLPQELPFGLYEIGVTLGFLGLFTFCYLSFMDAFPRMRVALMTSAYRDEVQIPVDPKTMEPLPAHE
jgi:hypothetical protein